jgi:hypothetical protein
VEVTSHGIVNGVADQLVSRTRHQDEGGMIRMQPAWGIQPTSLEALYSLGNQVVATQTIAGAAASWLAPRWPDSYSVSWPPDVDFDWKLAVDVQLAGGAARPATEVEVNAVGGLPVRGYSTVALTAAGIPSITISNETTEVKEPVLWRFGPQRPGPGQSDGDPRPIPWQWPILGPAGRTASASRWVKPRRASQLCPTGRDAGRRDAHGAARFCGRRPTGPRAVERAAVAGGYALGADYRPWVHPITRCVYKGNTLAIAMRVSGEPCNWRGGHHRDGHLRMGGRDR